METPEIQRYKPRHPKGPRGSIQGSDNDGNLIAYVEGREYTLGVGNLSHVNQSDLVDRMFISKSEVIEHLCEVADDGSRAFNAIELVVPDPERPEDNPEWRVVYLDGLIDAFS